ncbi:DUF2254 family protein [Streptomyces sp. NBC_00094]|uniref:DUF2254 family protein n=1 Tax=Streptomyces sp. NBC_00094 TaxID=2903620 RepID=UPI002259997C|nr:DUF2254 family protein [Streptomyces sp. NBC_00094]MCX5390550.1 DUF2254 domain-containing protein [Streptomyces sp. NBC_00094]
MADPTAPGRHPNAHWKPEPGSPGVLFRRPRRALRLGAAQLVCLVAGLVAGVLMPTVELHPLTESGPVVTLLFTIGFGVISLITIIYSLLFLVVQWAATTFTPRLGLFRDDPIVWRTFAFAVGVFVFCATAGLTIGNREQVSVAVPVFAVLLTLCSLAFMRALQARAFSSIQLGPVLEAISAHAHHVFDVLYAKPYDGPAHPDDLPSGTGRAVLWPHAGAVLQQIDVPSLVEAAAAHGSVVVLLQRPGGQLVRNRPVAHVHGGDLPDDIALSTLLPGVERTFDQDPELAFRLLADIALRALSAAVNDPATAVQALDHLEDALLRLATQDLDVGQVSGTGGVVRVVVPVPGWEQYARGALDDVVVAAQGSPMALLRVHRLIRRVLEACPVDRRPILESRLAWVEESVSERYPRVWEATGHAS